MKRRKISTRLAIVATLVVANLLLSPVVYAQTAPGGSLEDFLQDKNYVKIPITKGASGHLRLTVIVNGVSGDFILDTGAGATVIEKNRKEKFSLLVEKSTAKAVGVGGQQSVESARLSSLQIGALSKTNYPVHLISLDHTNTAFATIGEKKIDGVIGADILTGNKAIIDYANLVLYLQK